MLFNLSETMQSNMSKNSKISRVSAILINKKKQNVISLKTKIEIIRLSDKGEKTFIIVSNVQLPVVTIRTIIKNSDEIRLSITAVRTCSLETTSKRKPVIMEKMEIALILWIKDLNNKNIVITTAIIQRKVTGWFNDL